MDANQYAYDPNIYSNAHLVAIINLIQQSQPQQDLHQLLSFIQEQDPAMSAGANPSAPTDANGLVRPVTSTFPQPPCTSRSSRFEGTFQSSQPTTILDLPPMTTLLELFQPNRSLISDFNALPLLPSRPTQLTLASMPNVELFSSGVPTGPVQRSDRDDSNQWSTNIPIRGQPKPFAAGTARYRVLSNKQKFLVFIKVLFKILDRSNESLMLQQAKTVVAECTRRNRLGDSAFTPLQDTIRAHLRQLVGEVHWSHAKSVFARR